MSSNKMEGKSFLMSLTTMDDIGDVFGSLPAHSIQKVDPRSSLMLTFRYTVKIALTPFGQDEKQNHRTIAITRDNPSASVGRASKNNSKGLLATPNNAWFDYPILSRTHAKFTASLAEQVSQ